MLHSNESKNRIFDDCEKSPGNEPEFLLILKISGIQLKK